MTDALGIIAATAIFAWGVWDYFNSEHPSSTALVKAALGLGVVLLLVVRAVV